jgi:hypothetical protein
MNPRRCVILVALVLLGAIAGTRSARAGANETPGQSHRPHTYSAFLPVSDEFGPEDDAIFRKYVVKSQHFSLGAIYSDKGNDEKIEGGGIGNFFQFCTNRRADVMLVSTHGTKKPFATVIAKFRTTAKGKALRDSVFTYWNGIFVAGALQSMDFVDSGGNIVSYGIVATQTFYTTYFMTPQAFCWWSHCYSANLKMTGPAEARCYLGYDCAVSVGKCLCDEETVLHRMDGQEGQDKRPLGAALAGVNGLCPDNDPPSKLVPQGKLNTVLSPSVLDYAPKGVVCGGVPGFVQFDCSLDNAIPPGSIVSATGGAFLNNHQWAGNDRVTFDVVPTVPWPLIHYDVHENTSISDADHARLDGNTNPAVNARGPNQDDFIWDTNCPNCPGEIWFTLIDKAVNALKRIAGWDFVVYTPIQNMSASTYSGTVSLHVDGLTLPIELVSLTLTGGEARTLSWVVPIPMNALPGQSYGIHVTTSPNGGSPYTVDDMLVVGRSVQGSIKGGALVAVGPNALTVEVANEGATAVTLSGLTAMANAGWVTSVSPSSVTLGPHTSALLDVTCTVPLGTPAGSSAPLRLNGGGPTGTFPILLGTLRVQAPIELAVRNLVDCAPGSGYATAHVDVSCFADHALFPTWTAISAHGFPVVVNLPPMIPPHQPMSGSVSVSIPPDPSLVGTTDVVTIHASAEGYDIDLPVTIEITPAIEIDLSGLTEATICTGWSAPHAVPASARLVNHSDQPLAGSFVVEAWALEGPFNCPWSLPPHGTQSIPLGLIVPTDLAAGLYHVSARTARASMPEAAAALELEEATAFAEVVVSTPVRVDMRQKTVIGTAGHALIVEADLINLRNDRSMSGTLQWSDASGWIAGNPNAGYSLAPGETTTVEVTLQLPAMGPAAADTDSVALIANMTYDTGSPGSSFGWLDAIAEGMGTTDVPGGALGLLGTDIESIDPNPIRSATSVHFRLATAGRATVTVHDAAGRRVATLADGVLAAGRHLASWNGRTDGGGAAAVGVYFVRLETQGLSRSRKAVLMR